MSGSVRSDMTSPRRRKHHVRGLAAAIPLLFIAMQSSAGGLPAIDNAIREWARQPNAPTYKYALVDLNGDTAEDAIVLITDKDYCGSGGCSMVVLRGGSNGFQVVSSSTISREPILILPEKRNGWHTLSVLDAGGGATSGQVLMRYGTNRYPGNPSLQPKASKSQILAAKTLEFRQ